VKIHVNRQTRNTGRTAVYHTNHNGNEDRLATFNSREDAKSCTAEVNNLGCKTVTELCNAIKRFRASSGK
jgi:hypothetical protein